MVVRDGCLVFVVMVVGGFVFGFGCVVFGVVGVGFELCVFKCFGYVMLFSVLCLV